MNKKLLTLIVLLTSTLCSFAQWTNSGPDFGNGKMTQNGNRIYLMGTRLYHSDDNGDNWQVENTPSVSFNDLFFLPNKIIAATSKGLFVSYDNGSNWVSHNTGLSNTDSIGNIADISQKGNRLLLVAQTGIYYTDNDGVSWLASSSTTGLRVMAVINNTILTSKITGIWTSIDNGLTFTASTNTGIVGANPNIRDILNFNNVLYCRNISTLEIYKSIDSGLNWQLINTGITGSSTLSLIVVNNKIYTTTDNGLYELNTATGIWIISNLSTGDTKYILHHNNGRYFAYSPTVEQLQSTSNNGVTWQQADIGIYMQKISSLTTTSNNKLFAIGSSTFQYNNSDSSWTRFSPLNYNFGGTVTSSSTVYNFAYGAGNQYYAATDGGVWNSPDNGLTWTQHTTGLPTTTSNFKTVKDLYITGDTIVAATQGGIYRSLDQANTWQQVNPLNTADLYKYGNYLYATGNGVYRSADNGNSWSAFAGATSGGPFDIISGAGGKIFTAGGSVFLYADTTANSFTSGVGTGDFIGYENLLFFYASKLYYYDVNVSLSNKIDISLNLPCYYASSAIGCYLPYMSTVSGIVDIAVYNDNLWIGTKGFSTFYRSLGDFGFPVTTIEQQAAPAGVPLVVPNPANETISLKNIQPNTLITITNITGNIVLQTTINQSNQINISQLSSGIYFIQTQSKINTQTTKFIKQ